MTEITVNIENVSEPSAKRVLNELLNNEFSYPVSGEQKTVSSFVLRFGNMGEYAVVYDELLEQYHSDPLENQEYNKLYSVLPRTVSIEEGDTVSVSF